MPHTTPIRQTTPTIHSAETTAPSRFLAPTMFAEHQKNSQATSSERTTSVNTTTGTDLYDLIKARTSHVCVQPNKKTEDCRLYIIQSQLLRSMVFEASIYFLSVIALF